MNNNRRSIQPPCGKVLGHGESCCVDRFCDSCTEIVRLQKLVKLGELVVEDFLPNIGTCVLQNYDRLNNFLIEAKAVEVLS